MAEFYLIVSAAVYAPEKMGKPQLCRGFGVRPDQPVELIDVYPKEPVLSPLKAIFKRPESLL